MTGVAYERWPGATEQPQLSAVFRALHASRLDSFLADSHDDGVMVIDLDGRIVGGNLSLVRRTGFERSEMLGRAMVDVVAPAHRRRIQTAIGDALAGDSVRAHAAGVKSSGDTCDLAITFLPLFDEQRAVVGSLVITNNVSEAADVARDREREGHLLALASRVARFIEWNLNLDSLALNWSGQLAGVEAVLPSTLDGLYNWLLASDVARLNRAVKRSETQQRLLDVTLAVITTSGERHLRFIGVPSKPLAGQSRLISGAVYDVTAAVLEERQRHDAEQLLSSTVNALTDGFGIVGADWRFIFVNDRMVEMIGLDRASIVGETVWDSVPELCGTEFEIAFRTAVEQGTTVNVRDHLDVRNVWIEATAYPNGGGLAMHLRDVSESKLVSLNYQRAQDELVTLGRLLDISNDAIVVCDTQYRIQYVNDGALKLYKWDADHVVGIDSRDLVGFDKAQTVNAMSAVLADDHWSGRFFVTMVNGHKLTISSRWHLMRDEHGEPESILSVSADVTDELAREEAVHRAERLASLGTFAGGIAHDLNNMLTPILMASQMLGHALERQTDREMATMIETAARRGADMVRQVLGFARGIEKRSEWIDIADLLGELRGLVSGTLRPGVELVVSAPSIPVSFSGDETQVLQVLTNLVSNANDAIEGTGTITVHARLETPLEAEVGATHMLIDVIDTGLGMSQEVLAQVWEPFFTTKGASHGTGLGLPMVSAIVRSHGGTIAVESDTASGSRFTIRLPLGAQSQNSADHAEMDATETPRGEGQRVLVVDDEQEIRAILRNALAENGYNVSIASSADDAWRQLEEGRAMPDLILSDVSMPGGDGTALVQRLIDADCIVPIVLMSGLDTSATVSRAVSQRARGFLMKPLSTTTLLLAVHDALTPPGTRGEGHDHNP